MAKMTLEEIGTEINLRLRQCAGFGNDVFQKARVDALKYYHQRKRGDEIEGRSGVVAGDVSASVEANLAQMMDAYTTDNVVEFDPIDADDEEAAQLETDAVVYFVMSRQNGFLHLLAACKDALLLRNGVMKVWVENEKTTETRTFENVPEEALSEFSADEIVAYNDGVLTIRQTNQRKELKSEAVAIENFYYLQDEDNFDLQYTSFCAERHVDARSRLIELGHDKKIVAGLKSNPAAASLMRPDSYARNPGGSIDPAPKLLDSSQDLIEWYECYAYMDIDGDGVAERVMVAYVDAEKTVLKSQAVSLVPFATGVTLLTPHRLTGISDYDKLRQTQDEHTGLKRGLYDNVNTVTKNRIAYLDGRVNVDDVSDGRTNGAMRVSANAGVEDVRAAVMAFSVPDNSGNILANIEALKRERTELGGASLDMATGQMQIGGERMGSQGLDRAYSVAEQLAAHKTKVFAATLLRNLFLLAHATLRENFATPVPIKRQGKWLSPIPAKWPRRHCVTVKVGMSPGERQRKSSALMQILNSQVQLAGQGMDEVLVNVVGFYRTLMDWARINDVLNPEQYFIDPTSPEALKAFANKRAAQQAAKQKQDALMTQAVDIEKIRVALDRYVADQETVFKYWNAVLQAQIKEAEIVGDATTKLVTAKHGAAPNAKSNGTTEPGDSGASSPVAR